MSSGSWLLAAAVIVAACDRRAPSGDVPRLPQAAYVWQRTWTPAVRDAVVQASPVLDGLEVLAGEVPDGASQIDLVRIDAAALAASRRPITLVVRINGAQLADPSLAPVTALASSLRASNVNVVGVQVDHDCATSRLPAYAAWLAAHRPAGWKFSITALPTWAGGDLPRVAAAVDEMVVQVHAVRAPLIFDGNTAWRDLARFAATLHGTTPLRVALPTYGAVVRGTEVRVDPRDVLAFVHRLEARPPAGVVGIVWFRLPVADDAQTWSAATFTAVLADRALEVPRARVALVARGADRYDIVATNDGDGAADLPRIRIDGSIAAADVIGYREVRAGHWEAPPRSIGRHERLVIGWIRGRKLQLVEES